MQSHTKPQLDTPKWSALLVEAVNKPGLIMDAYSAFHNYSIGNQILAIVPSYEERILSAFAWYWPIGTTHDQPVFTRALAVEAS